MYYSITELKKSNIARPLHKDTCMNAKLDLN